MNEIEAAGPQPHHAWPISHYHEEYGPVLWHLFPIVEPPWVGTPNDSDWPGYHTHFQPLPEPPTAIDPTITLRQAIDHIRAVMVWESFETADAEQSSAESATPDENISQNRSPGNGQ
jgi:hypothetical protein